MIFIDLLVRLCAYVCRYFDDLRAVLKKDCSLYGKTLECFQLGQFYEVECDLLLRQSHMLGYKCVYAHVHSYLLEPHPTIPLTLLVCLAMVHTY